MKWFQFDSDTPDDLKIRALMLRDPAKQFGHWSLLLCHVARKGKGNPGEGLRKDGSPLDLDEMAIACAFESTDDLVPFLDRLAKLKLIDPVRWTSDRVVFLPAMANRADVYSKRKARRLVEEVPEVVEQKPEVFEHNGKSPVLSVLSVDQKDPKRDQKVSDQVTLPIDGTDQVDALVTLWNRTAAKGLPRVAKVTDERRRAWNAALARAPNLADWERAIAFLNGSDWWLGKAGKGNGHDNWTGDLDYLAKPGKLQAALEKADAAKVRAGDGGRTGTGAGSADEAARRGRVAPVPGKYADLEAD